MTEVLSLTLFTVQNQMKPRRGSSIRQTGSISAIWWTKKDALAQRSYTWVTVAPVWEKLCLKGECFSLQLKPFCISRALILQVLLVFLCLLSKALRWFDSRVNQILMLMGEDLWNSCWMISWYSVVCRHVDATVVSVAVLSWAQMVSPASF